MTVRDRAGWAGSVFVFEKRPRWEPELKRQLPEYRLQVRPCRTGAQLLSLVREQPRSLLVLNLEKSPAECLRLLATLLEWRLPSRAIAIAGPDMDELEWPARELGALDFLPSTVTGSALARLCRRQLAPPPDLAESILVAMLSATDNPPQPAPRREETPSPPTVPGNST